MPFQFSVSDLIPASPQDIYDTWLSSSGHEKITGGQKAQISVQEGAAFILQTYQDIANTTNINPIVFDNLDAQLATP